MATATKTKAALKAKTLMANLTVNDLQRSMRFFEGLGFAVDEKWEDEGRVLGVMLRAGDAQIGLMQDDWQKGRDRQKGAGVRVFIGTKQDIDEMPASSARAGLLRVSAAMVFMLLNRKCGRMRACSACTRAVACSSTLCRHSCVT
jgi:predicted lactoylglutathione lyase